MKKYLFVALALTTLTAQAGVFKCKTPDGFNYSEKPCPTGTAAGSIQAIPTSFEPQRPAAQEQSGSINASAGMPPITEKQRGAYNTFLSKPNPKAFVICSDGHVMSIAGKGNGVKQQLASLPEGCSPYAIDDTVVWTGK